MPWAYHRWEQMSAALRHNGPVDALHHPYHYLADDAEAARLFSAAQHAGSRSLGYALACRVDFTPFTCLLDLGGGSGAYTVEILQRYPHLRTLLAQARFEEVRIEPFLTGHSSLVIARPGAGTA